MLKKTHLAYLILAAALLLSACIPTVADDGTTLNATEAAALVETAVAEALNAQATQNAENKPLPTATLAATNTAIPAPATVTPVPTITPLVLADTPTAAAGGGGGGTGQVTYPNACDPDIQKRPYDNTVMRKGDPFDIKFIIENTGTTTWDKGKDLVYWSGPDMTNGQFTAIELPEMAPGDRFQVGPYDATAPNEKGHHVMEFKLEGGFCRPYVAINVE